MINESNIIVLDVESSPFYDDRADKRKDELKVVGIRYPNGKKLMLEHPAQKQQIQMIISSNKYIVGHNLKDRKYIGKEMGYDAYMMKKAGYKFLTHNNSHNILIDTQEITEKRGRSMLYLKLTMKQMGLDFISKFFKLVDDDTGKGTFDYKLLRRPLTPTNRTLLREYLFRDLDVTWKLFEYYYNTFSFIKEKLRPEHRINFNWLIGSAGTTGYRWYCKVMKVKEEYDYNRKGDFTGAWMWVHEYIDRFDNVIVNDFASLYPNMRASLNLDSRCPEEFVIKNEDGTFIDGRNNRPLWHGGGIFKSVEEDQEHGIVGYYHSDKLNPFAEEVITTFHNRNKDKKLYKETGDIKYYYRQLGAKILMNSSYGAGGSPAFVNMYDKITAEDTTRAGQSCIRHAKSKMEENGYVVAYIHTDSLYTEDVYNDFERFMKVIEEINKEQKSSLPFDMNTHNFAYEKTIDKMWLQKKDDGTNAKQRNFIVYTDKEGNKKAGFTGGKLADFNVSKVVKKVWNERISKDLISGKEDLYYDIDNLLMMCKLLIKEDENLLIIRKKVKDISEYKATTSQPAKISTVYGAGEHFLVPNKYIGVGDSTGKHYLAKMSELKEAFGDSWIDAVDYSVYVKELKVFVRPEYRKMINKI